MSIKRSCLAVLGASLLLSVTQSAFGQGGDFPTLQGSAARTGANSDPANFNSGRTVLQWFVGNNPNNPYGTIVVDDDYPGAVPATPGVTTSTTTPPVTIGTAGPTTGSWLTPLNPTYDASIYYQPVGAPAAYHYSTCVPALQGGDPSVASTGTANKWTWTAPLGNFGFTDTYALYVYIPFGFTGIANGSLTPQRYFVYHINFGNGQTLTDVVDTFVSGYGWIRLGGGGFPTNAVFAYDGIHPISVNLYNTIPLNGNGTLTSGTVATANQYVVYADAFKAVPTHGYFSASPTSAFLRNPDKTPAVDPSGDIDVATQINGAHKARITNVFNQFTSGFVGGNYVTVPQAVVKNYIMDPETWAQPPTPGGANGVPQASWTWQASLQSVFNGTVVTNGSATTGWTADTNNTYEGTGYLVSPIVSTPANEQTVTYTPASLLAGSYSIYAYFPGNKAPESYGTAVTYNILIGGTIVSSGTVNEATGGGWIQLGNQTWNNNQGIPSGNLTVQLTNLSLSGADTGKLAYASAVEFTSPNVSYIVNSSPVHAQVHIKKLDGTTPLTQVVIVADENGKIHCLDELGNGDGTTTEYWSYPSTPDPTNPNYQDPNLTNGIDGPPTSTVPVAIMPAQFSLSTALVRQADATDPRDRLYITSTNGRVYCINMQGRGDYNTTTNHPGSTSRYWSYPNDYPEQQVSSSLGSIRGSLVYADSNTSPTITKPTIFVPAAQGRIYSLDALGNLTTRTTTVNWTFPALKQPTLPPIEMTPNLAFGNLYFGTTTDPNSGAAGTVYAINAQSGSMIWTFNGATNGAIAGANNAVTETVGDFIAGPASASATTLTETNPPYTVVPHDSVYFINSNDSVYGFNAATGGLLTDTQGIYTYDDSELGVVCTQNLSINFINTYDRTGQTGGVPRLMPVVMIPDTSGQLYAVFANIDDYTVFSYPGDSASNTPAFVSLDAFGSELFGSNLTSVALSNSRMVVADDAGFMYVWDNDSANYGLENQGVPPPGNIIPPNSPLGGADAFRYIHMKAITAQGATALGTVNAVNQGADPRDTYTQVAGNGINGKGIFDVAAPPSPATELAFEWGETVNILVYDFPYQPANPTVTNGAASAFNGEMVNVRLSQNGKTFYNRSIPAHQFMNPTTAPTTDGRRTIGINAPLPNGWYDDGYAVIPITLTGLGNNAVPPGPGVITADITTSALSPTTPGNTAVNYQEIASDPSPNFARIPYLVNNPIAFAVVDPFTNGTRNPLRHSYSETTNRYDKEANNNGNVISSQGEIASQFLQSLGQGLDGQTLTQTMYLYDRSLMVETPVGALRNVRVSPYDLAWQGGANSIFNALTQTAYPGFEDPPTNYPNNSLDYPNISRDRLGFTVYQGGGTTNTLLTGSVLNPPTNSAGQPFNYQTDNPDTRILIPTPLQIALNVPQFQPAVDQTKLLAASSNPDDLLSVKPDSANNVLPQGYYTVLDLYVDSNNDGTFVDTDAFRQFHLSANVERDPQLTVGTPTVDLGNLANSTGFSPLDPLSQGVNGRFNPSTGVWRSAYQPFTIQNNSNYNLTDLRVAKASTVGLSNEQPWLFTASGNDFGAYLDGSLDMWSNLDTLYAPTNPHNGNANNVISQKARVTDGVGTQVLINPSPRANPNLGIGTGVPALNPNYPVKGGTPYIGVSVPFGFPSGTYSSNIKVIDDSPTGGGNTLEQVWESIFGGASAEPSTNTDLIVSFTSREVRLTNANTTNTAPMEPFQFINTFESVNAGQTPSFTPSYSNPTAIRDSYGSIIAAWSSNESQVSTTAANQRPPSTDDKRRIGVYSVPNSATFGQNGITPPTYRNDVSGVTPQSPLLDLDFFTGGNTASWFKTQSPSGGYPATSIIPTDNNGAVIFGTDSYDSPSFPLTGSKDPISQTDLGYEYMAYVGKAQKSTPTGRVDESHIFLTQIKSGSGGSVTLDAVPGSPWNTTFPTNVPTVGALGEDPLTAKGKPTVAQTGNSAMVFYGVTEGSSSGIHYSLYSVGGKGFGNALSLNFGTGFQSVSQPKAMIRKYIGSNPSYTPNLLDLTFTGQLKGQAHSDVYMAQMRLGTAASGDWQVVDHNGTSILQTGSGTPFAYFSQQVNELLAPDRDGTFRARGVEWDRNQPLYLYEYINGVATDVLVEPTPGSTGATTRNSDRETGIISYDTIFGGKVYIDPELGTVRFATAVPPQGVQIRLTYTPGFLRVSRTGGSEAYSEPTGIYENNYTSDVTEWYTQSGAQLPSTTAQDARFVYMYGRASSFGQTARPYMATMRLGVRLPYQIAVAPGGLPINGTSGNTSNGLVVSGNKGPYQIDPANGRVYFTALDEDNTVSITFTGVNTATGGYYNPITVSGANVTWIGEEGESPVLIDNAVNEANLCTFLDPFTFSGTGQLGPPMTPGRPALFWMFYTSTRAGSPDIFMQTIAPRFAPFVK
jgi:hypothetical protein